MKKYSVDSKSKTDQQEKNKAYFPKKLEDSSIDFTMNLEFSMNTNESNIPDSKSSSPKFEGSHFDFIQNEKISKNDLRMDLKSFDGIISNNYSLSTAHFNNSTSRQLIIINSKKKSLRLFNIWPSDNRFFLNGRLMSGPKSDNCHYLFVIFLIVGISIVFFVLVIPYLWNDVSPILPCFIIYLFVSTLTFLFLTTFTDPGIIPRKKVWELTMGAVPENFRADENKSRRNGKTRKKYCRTCEIYRPGRASHCNDCGNCVEVFDHHCPFVNNCIGKRNYKLIFFLYIINKTKILSFLFFYTCNKLSLNIKRMF
jgi:hypothetical protein